MDLIKIWKLGAVLALGLLSSLALRAQGRLEQGGVTAYWGLVPADIVARQHPLDGMHGGAPKEGGQQHHLVLALFDTGSGRRIENAVVRAQLSETGIADAPPKYLTPMKINEAASFGQVFGVAKDGPYRFKLWIRLPDRPQEIEFTFAAWSPHRSER